MLIRKDTMILFIISCCADLGRLCKVRILECVCVCVCVCVLVCDRERDSKKERRMCEKREKDSSPTQQQSGYVEAGNYWLPRFFFK